MHMNGLIFMSLCSTVPALTSLGQYQYELCELSQLAWRGLEESNILFLEKNIPREVLAFSERIELLSKVRHGGMCEYSPHICGCTKLLPNLRGVGIMDDECMGMHYLLCQIT